jgi:hypothetical protein
MADVFILFRRGLQIPEITFSIYGQPSRLLLSYRLGTPFAFSAESKGAGNGVRIRQRRFWRQRPQAPETAAGPMTSTSAEKSVARSLQATHLLRIRAVPSFNR